jgi:hypothetical protein
MIPRTGNPRTFFVLYGLNRMCINKAAISQPPIAAIEIINTEVNTGIFFNSGKSIKKIS